MIETDGLVIKSVRKSDGGTYTCWARVPHTGELEERDIKLDVSLNLDIQKISRDLLWN